jgi:tetratricopeptide (TPR) repeat protein
MAQLRSEEGNLLGVLREALGAGDVATVVRLFAALGGYWTVEGSHLKVVSLARQVEDVVIPAPVPPGLEDAFRTALVFIITNRLVFVRERVDDVAASLRELGPGSEPRTRANVTVVLALTGTDTEGAIQALLELTEDPDPTVARVALGWATGALENVGDIAGARSAARRALAAADEEEGPWTAALLTAQLASLALQAGDTAEATAYAASALPMLTAIGAWDDVAQTRSMLVLAAIRTGDLDEAERLLSQVESDEAVDSIFGGAIGRLAGRAELLLARGETDAGLRAYRDAVVELIDRGVPWVELPADFAPWIVFPEAASIAAHCRAGRPDDVRRERDALRTKLVTLLASDDLDYPVVGCGLFAMGVWELVTGGSREAARRLLGYAVAFSFSRMLPSLDLDWAERLLSAKPEEPRPAPEVRNEARELLMTL